MSVSFGWPARAPGGDAPPSSVVTVGVFDGFHRGHQALLGSAVERGQDLGIPTIMLTFDPHPLSVLFPERAPRTLLPISARIELGLAYGANSIVVLPFDNDLALLSAEEFVDLGLVGHLGMRSMVVGENFRCGRNGRGDLSFLRQRGSLHGYDVRSVPLVRLGNLTCSSTEIRRRLADGDLDTVNALLGRVERRLLSA